MILCHLHAVWIILQALLASSSGWWQEKETRLSSRTFKSAAAVLNKTKQIPWHWKLLLIMRKTVYPRRFEKVRLFCDVCQLDGHSRIRSETLHQVKQQICVVRFGSAEMFKAVIFTFTFPTSGAFFSRYGHLTCDSCTQRGWVIDSKVPLWIISIELYWLAGRWFWLMGPRGSLMRCYAVLKMPKWPLWDKIAFRVFQDWNCPLWVLSHSSFKEMNGGIRVSLVGADDARVKLNICVWTSVSFFVQQSEPSQICFHKTGRVEVKVFVIFDLFVWASHLDLTLVFLSVDLRVVFPKWVVCRTSCGNRVCQNNISSEIPTCLSVQERSPILVPRNLNSLPRWKILYELHRNTYSVPGWTCSAIACSHSFE